MEKRIKERFNDAILNEAMRRYNIQPENIQLLDGFESFMYEFKREDGEYILRISHSFRRSVELIRGEVDWINYLAAGGAGVARAVLSAAGNLAEMIPDGAPEEDGQFFLVTAFVKAQGHTPKKEDQTPEFYEAYGRLLGRMHALARSYHPSDPCCIRPQWDDPINMFADQYLPPSESIALEKYQELMKHLRTLPKDAEGFGMIHQDAHMGNFFVDDRCKITLFDFDDCCYGHFTYDIAMVLFYAAIFQPDPAAFTRHFMAHFLKGYRQENTLDPKWLKELPHFLKLREIDLYSVMFRSYGDLEHVGDPWSARFIQGRKENIESGRPFLSFDFDSLSME